MRLVTLTTDFGSRDGFAGTMRGVLLSRAPRATPVDLAHDLDQGDVRTAAFVLRSAAPFFPRGTVHLVVVDPGVGTPRRPLAMRARGRFFVGPDNGVLTWAAPAPAQVVELANPAYRLRPVSRTFHGRDVFAPAAAALAAGVPLGRLGPRRRTWVRLPFPGPSVRAGRLAGEVLVRDRFGNLVTNLAERACRARWGSRRLAVHCAGRRFPVREAFGLAPAGGLVAVFGSSGFLELAVRDGSAARALRAGPGRAAVVGPA